MGSSCSSRQSGKDSASIRSEDLSMDDQSQNGKQEKAWTNKSTKNQETRSGVDMSKSKSKGGGRYIESDFSSCGDEGAAAATPLSSSTTGSGIDRARGNLHGATQVKEELPTLSFLKEHTRALIEGKMVEGRKSFMKNRFCICLLGNPQDMSSDLITIEEYLNSSLVPALHCDGQEAFVINPQSRIPIHRSSYFLPDLVSDFIIEESKRSIVHVILYTKCNSFVTDLPSFISKSQFQDLELALEEDSDKELLKKWYSEDDSINPSVFRLRKSRDNYSELQSAEASEFDSGYKNWCQDYANLVTCLAKVSAKDNNNSLMKHLLIEEFNKLKKDSFSDINFQLFIKESESELSCSGNLEDLFQIKETNNTVRIPLAEVGTEASLNSICNQIEETVKKSIQSQDDSILMHPLDEGIKKKLLREIEIHNDFCKNFSENSKETSIFLEQIKNYLMGETSKPLVICGERGCGKTTLCALTAMKAPTWNAASHCINRFVGLTENSSSLDGLLYYLLEHSRVLYGVTSVSLKSSNISKNIETLWKKANSERSLVVLIDGIDEFDSEASLKALDWIFGLPPHVKVILTMQQNSSVYECLSKKIDSECILQLSITPDASKTLFKNFLSVSDLEFDPAATTLERLQEASSSFTPLYLLIITKIIFLSRLEENIPSSLEHSITELFRILETIFIPEMLHILLGCLSLTKLGILQSEVIAILKSTNVNSPNITLDWVLLQKLLAPLLRTRYENSFVLISWSSQYIREMASKFYLNSTENKLKCQEVFRKIIYKCDENQVFDFVSWSPGEKSISHLRQLQECSTLLRIKPDSTDHFFNYKWLTEKIKWCNPLKLLDDLREMVENNYSKDLNILKEIIFLSVPSLIYDENQIYIQIYGRLKWYKENEDDCPRLSSLLESITQSHHTRLIPLSQCLECPQQEEAVADDNEIYINGIFRIPNNPHYAISISSRESRVTVWNIISMNIVRTLNGINHPKNLEMIDDYRCLLLCGRELRIYNLNEGSFLMKLREVMNQKTPFFGLHNSDHVVALSRSRMYVNMMNLTEGNCVTTFKVGEDRFLNSLMVSGNGKICVCGDDSQKPSSLLVWDLELRKLMYDLRIPHHEFTTNLAAITVEGHYVCCVSKEVDDPAPNFIVVYDLQSGTLFKRWKPNYNTISIAISTSGTCVIVGLEDSSIMAYDLITGNARWTVLGHCSPPDIFKIDQHGSVLLSYDSAGKDQSLRVWDIQTGESLAAFTPDRKISACEVTNEGKGVILALEGRSEILSFLLCRKDEELEDMIPNTEFYGDEEFNEKIVDLSES